MPRKSPLESGFIAPQFFGQMRAGTPNPKSAAAIELEALFSAALQRPLEQAAPTVIVRRKRLLMVEAEKAPADVPAVEPAAAERTARVFVRRQAAIMPEA